MSDYQNIDLKDYRENVLRVTQSELSDEMKQSLRTIQHWEKHGIPVSKRPSIREKLTVYANKLGVKVSEEVIKTISDKNVEEDSLINNKSKLSDFSDFEIIEYISENIDRFQGLSVFRKIVGLEEMIELRKKVEHLTEEVIRFKNKSTHSK